MTFFNAGGHRWRHADCQMRFHEVVIREIERNRSLKIFKLFAESVREACQAAAVHPQRVILLFNVRRGNQSHKTFGLNAVGLDKKIVDLCRRAWYQYYINDGRDGVRTRVSGV